MAPYSKHHTIARITLPLFLTFTSTSTPWLDVRQPSNNTHRHRHTTLQTICMLFGGVHSVILPGPTSILLKLTAQMMLLYGCRMPDVTTLTFRWATLRVWSLRFCTKNRNRMRAPLVWASYLWKLNGEAHHTFAIVGPSYFTLSFLATRNNTLPSHESR